MSLSSKTEHTQLFEHSSKNANIVGLIAAWLIH